MITVREAKQYEIEDFFRIGMLSVLLPPQGREVCACVGVVDCFLLISNLFRGTAWKPHGDPSMCICDLDNIEAEAGAAYQTTK